jgi:NitT/TauT family transport system substrate-binding protein
MFNYKDYGVRIYGNAVLANSKFLQEHPRAVAAFLLAYNRGLKETLADPEGALEYVRQRDPTINVATELKRLRALIAIIATPNVRTSGLSEVDKGRMQRQAEDVARAFGLERVPEADQIFNPRFLPPRSERML